MWVRPALKQRSRRAAHIVLLTKRNMMRCEGPVVAAALAIVLVRLVRCAIATTGRGGPGTAAPKVSETLATSRRASRRGARVLR